MDFHILNASFIHGIISSDETKKINLHQIMYWLEFATSVIGVLLNVVLIVHTTKIFGKGSCQGPMTAGLCSSRINLWISQLIVCLISVVTCLLSQTLDQTKMQSKIWWRSFLNGASVAIFCSNVLTGRCLMSWTHWYAINVWIPHNQPIATKHLPQSHRLLSPFRMTVATTHTLWLSAFLFIVWLTLNVSALNGLTTSEMSEDQRCAPLYFKLYSLVGLATTTLLLFLNFTSIPPVSSNSTQKALNMKHRNCRDADCVCSGSGELELTTESETQTNYQSKNIVKSLSPNQSHALPIVKSDSVIIKKTNLELENKNIIPQQRAINNLSCSPTVDLDCRSNAKTPSFYSADVSEMSIPPDTNLPINPFSRTTTANRKSKKKIRNSTLLNRADSTSPLPVKLIPPRRRKLKKRVQKKFKSVTIEFNKKLTSGQLDLIWYYLAMHTPHWSLLACASFAWPTFITIVMSSYRLWTNLICCLNPLVHGLCYPGHPNFRIRKLRLVHPLLTSISSKT